MNSFAKVDNVILSATDRSSLISEIKWNRTGSGKNPKGTLSLTFKSNNTVYEYTEVPSTILQEMLLAESFGKYFHENIKDKFTTYKEI